MALPAIIETALFCHLKVYLMNGRVVLELNSRHMTVSPYASPLCHAKLFNYIYIYIYIYLCIDNNNNVIYCERINYKLILAHLKHR